MIVIVGILYVLLKSKSAPVETDSSEITTNTTTITKVEDVLGGGGLNYSYPPKLPPVRVKY